MNSILQPCISQTRDWPKQDVCDQTRRARVARTRRAPDYKDENGFNAWSAIFAVASCTLIVCVIIPVAYSTTDADIHLGADIRFKNKTASRNQARVRPIPARGKK